MKRNRLLSLMALSVISFTLLQSYSGGYSIDIRATSASPGCSGSGCHSTTSASSAPLSIQVFDASNNAILQYDPNTTYKVKISLAKSNVAAPLTAGFQATFFDANNNNAGTFPGISGNTQVKEANVAAVKVITHKTSNVVPIVSGSTVEWEFDWKTPLLGANDITISAIANDANANSTSSGDIIIQNFLFLPKNTWPTAIGDISKGIEAIYPNPTTGMLTVKLTDLSASEISIFSITGQLVKHISAEGNKVNLDLAELNTGNYIISIAQNGKLARQQFVKY